MPNCEEWPRWVLDARGWGWGNGNGDAVQTSWSIKRVRGESWWLTDLGLGTGSSQQLHGGIITVAYLMSCPPRWTERSFPLLTVTALMLSTWPNTEEVLICLQWIKWVVRSSKMVGEKGSVLMDSYIFSVKAFFLWDESLKQNSNSASYKPHAEHRDINCFPSVDKFAGRFLKSLFCFLYRLYVFYFFLVASNQEFKIQFWSMFVVYQELSRTELTLSHFVLTWDSLYLMNHMLWILCCGFLLHQITSSFTL